MGEVGTVTPGICRLTFLGSEVTGEDMCDTNESDDLLVCYLKDELVRCLTKSQSFWGISIEHRVVCLTAYIEFLSENADYDYRLFLRSNGFSRNGRLLAEAMRYVAIEDFAVNPSLHSSVISAALQPIFQAFQDKILPLAPIIVNPAKKVELLRRIITDHVDWLVRPNQYGNAIEIEAKLLLDEQIIKSVCNDVFQKLNWRYLIYLNSIEIEFSFTQTHWHKRSSYFELDGWFPEIWERYLTQLLPTNKSLSTFAELRQEWLNCLGE
jgi:hypothetical protein